MVVAGLDELDTVCPGEVDSIGIFVVDGSENIPGPSRAVASSNGKFGSISNENFRVSIGCELPFGEVSWCCEGSCVCDKLVIS